MGLFSKKVKFVSAVCPECKGHLELDSKLETAFCQYCGAQCIVKNAPSSKQNQGKLETIISFVERQQALKRQDKQEKQRKIEEEERKQKEHFKKCWWVYLLGVIALFGYITLMSILENQGII